MTIHWWTLLVGVLLGATLLSGFVQGLFRKVGVSGQ